MPNIGSPCGGATLINSEEDIWHGSTCVCGRLEGVASSIARGFHCTGWVSFNREVKITTLGRNSYLVVGFFTLSRTIFVVPVLFVSCSISIVSDAEVTETIIGRVSLWSKSGHLDGENTLGIGSSWVN